MAYIKLCLLVVTAILVISCEPYKVQSSDEYQDRETGRYVRVSKDCTIWGAFCEVKKSNKDRPDESPTAVAKK
jgi:hypothetical protein